MTDMAELAALLLIVGAALWLAVVAVVAAVSPARALSGVALMGSSPAIHLTELGIRALIGAAMVLRAPFSAAPAVFQLIGWFLVITAAIILAIPRRRHAAFSRAAARRLSPWFIRWIASPAALIGAALLVWAAI